MNGWTIYPNLSICYHVFCYNASDIIYNASSFAMRHKLHLELLHTWKFYLKHRPHCTFVTSKTRLAPMKTKLSPVKTISLPKLLLNVAVLEIRLDKVIIKEVHLTIQNTTFWTDSVLVLQYIRNGFKIYSTNQVTGIKEESLLNNITKQI